jgi:hypothetical protein
MLEAKRHFYDALFEGAATHHPEPRGSLRARVTVLRAASLSRGAGGEDRRGGARDRRGARDPRRRRRRRRLRATSTRRRARSSRRWPPRVAAVGCSACRRAARRGQRGVVALRALPRASPAPAWAGEAALVAGALPARGPSRDEGESGVTCTQCPARPERSRTRHRTTSVRLGALWTPNPTLVTLRAATRHDRRELVPRCPATTRPRSAAAERPIRPGWRRSRRARLGSRKDSRPAGGRSRPSPAERLADLLDRGAVVDRAADVDAELVHAVERREHGDVDEAARPAVEARRDHTSPSRTRSRGLARRR